MKIKGSLLLIVALLIASAVIWMLDFDATRRPNILLITLDTTRVDHLSCYGYPRDTTPNLDRLARDGQLFKNVLAVSSWTLPTHASLFTGLFPITHGAHYSDSGKVSLDSAVDIGQLDFYGQFKADGLSDQSVTLAETLKGAGYRTGGVGAGPWLKPIFGLDRGFDFYDCDVNAIAGRKADEVTELGRRFIKEPGSDPFFLFLNYFDPHDPYLPPEEYLFKFFDRGRIDEIRGDPALGAEFELSRYDGEIGFMDAEIGRIIETLKEQELFDDTWIIVIGDHGEHFGEHDLRGHGYALFEETIRCPLIIKWPAGWKPAPNPEDRCQQTDLMPTILDRLALEATAPVEGRPLGAPPRPGVCELYRNQGNVTAKGERYDRNLSAVYAGDYKLIQSTRESDQDAGLFHLGKDRGEQRDLASTQPRVAEALATILEDWKNARLDPLAPRKIDSVDAETRAQLEALGYGH